MNDSLRDRLFQEILMARERVYAVGERTPLETIEAPVDATVYLKREDLSMIHAYKWRGAYNCMATLSPEERERGVVTASAGNHAQGVAVAAQRLDTFARIYMPQSTPRMKQIAVQNFGGDRVETILHGDDYSAAAAVAAEDVAESGSVFIHPFDDLATMGGQGTIADEVVMSGTGPFDVAFLQIGGGGLAASVACWLRTYYPDIQIIGVEGVEQASMAAAWAAGEPVALDYVDVFCDGTAVKKTGAYTYPLCRELLDELITVTNEEVCAAVQVLWEAKRCIPEPSGAMGLAGVLKEAHRLKGKSVLSIVCGANLDFGQLAWIARHAGIGARRRRFYRFEIGEEPGTLLRLLESTMEGLNIVEVQYGKIHPDTAWPVIAFDASPPELELFGRRLKDMGIRHEDVTSQEDVEFRIIRYDPQLFKDPYFIRFEFPERAGALHDFLAFTQGNANLCYFNYAFTGEQVGRALMGFEFESDDDRQEFDRYLRESHHAYYEVSGSALRRILEHA